MPHAKFFLPFVVALLAAPAVASEAYDRIKFEAGEAIFDLECRRCHVVDSRDPSYGPLLSGVVGRQAGVVEGYEYSDALASSGIVWTQSALRAWLEDNDGFMPGTKMRHVGVTDRTVQDFIIFYLENFED